MTVKEAQKLRNILLLVGSVIMLLGYLYAPFVIVGVAVAFSCLIPHFLYNKCPHCRKQLGKNEGEYCQFCGKHID